MLQTEPAGCDPSYYNPDFLARRCNITRYSPYCIEMYGIDAVQYDPGVVQQQIYNLHLNITFLFLGDANYRTVVAQRLNASAPVNVSFLAYDWTPSIETSEPSLTRVALPSYSDACWNGNQNETTYFDGVGSVDCDFPSQAILKYYSASIAGDGDYADAVHLMTLFNFANRYQQSLLPGMAALDRSNWQAYADYWTCVWLQEYVHLWSSWVEVSPQQYVMTIPTSAWAPVIVIVGVLASFSLMLHVFLYRQRRHPLIMSSSPLFGQMIISGSWFLFVAVGIMAWKQVDGVCSVIPIFLCIAYTLVIGTLFAKTWRLNRIFHGASLKSVRVTAWDVLAFISLFFTFDFIINTAWILIDRPVAQLDTDSTNSLARIYVCSSQYYALWYTLLIVPKGLLLLYGAFLAYHVRHISQSFNESRYIALAILHFILFGVIVIPLDQALQHQLIVHYLLVTLMLCLCIFVTLSLIFLPKIYAIVYKKKGKKPVKDDVSKEEPPTAAGQRWMRDRVVMEQSDSGKLSFPSLTSSGGFLHAMKLVRLVAENLYREHGIGEYWQFCVAVRNMSQQELEARAPLLVHYLDRMQLIQQQQQPQPGYGHRGPGVAAPHLSSEEKEQADTAATTEDAAAQTPVLSEESFTLQEDAAFELVSTAARHHTVDVEPAEVDHRSYPCHTVDHMSYPITQASYSAPQSFAGVRPSRSTTASVSHVAIDLPPLPKDAWTVDEAQAAMVEKAVLTFAGPALAQSPSHSAGTTALPKRSHTASDFASPSMSASSPPSFPLSVGSMARSTHPESSYLSQAAFSVSQPQAVAGTKGAPTSVSLPSPSSVGSSVGSPSSPLNHRSSTSNISDSGSRGSGEDGAPRDDDLRKGDAQRSPEGGLLGARNTSADSSTNSDSSGM